MVESPVMTTLTSLSRGGTYKIGQKKLSSIQWKITMFCVFSWVYYVFKNTDFLTVVCEYVISTTFTAALHATVNIDAMQRGALGLF